MSEIVSEEIRNQVIAEAMNEPQNKVCFDCQGKDPKWSSPYLGIFICFECAGRHRGYGTHISFIRSIDLDKWNQKQLKSIQLTGNKYTLERWTQMGIPRAGNFFDYESNLVMKFRTELANRVKGILDSTCQSKPKIDTKLKIEKEENPIEQPDNNTVVEVEKEQHEPPKEEYKEPIKFEIKENVQIKSITEGKAGKKNKIKKVEVDFDFDSFNDINFAEFDKQETTEEPLPIKKDEELEEKENQKVNNNFKSYDIKLSEDEIKKKFANKKAISSDDYAALEDNGNDNQYYSNKIKQMGNATAISSNDIYGIKEEDNTPSLTSKLKDTALYYTLAAAEKAKVIKNQTTAYINKVQNKFNSNSNY